jgi:dihydrofolate reductase
MSRIVTFIHSSLDGVMQSPGSPDEDPSGGFKHGGWAPQFADEKLMSAIGQHMQTSGSLLFGRKTYEHFFKVWPNRTDNPFTPVLNNSMKYVASRTLKEPLPWQNSTLLSGDAEQAVAKLRRKTDGKDIVILGSCSLVHSLLRANLIDALTFTINPILLGKGKRLFPEGELFAKLRLAECVTTPKGVMLVTYEPEPTAGKAA